MGALRGMPAASQPGHVSQPSSSTSSLESSLHTPVQASAPPQPPPQPPPRPPNFSYNLGNIDPGGSQQAQPRQQQQPQHQPRHVAPRSVELPPFKNTDFNLLPSAMAPQDVIRWLPLLKSQVKAKADSLATYMRDCTRSRHRWAQLCDSNRPFARRRYGRNALDPLARRRRNR